MIFAVDPGTEASGYVLLDGRRAVTECGFWPNGDLLSRLRSARTACLPLACEMVSHYGVGMPVGREVFETVEWIGRFREAWESRGGLFVRIYRREVKNHLCGSAKAKDANIRQALIDRYGGKGIAVGRKKDPGPLYGVSGHAWQALAVAVTALDTKLEGGDVPCAQAAKSAVGPIPPISTRPFSDDAPATTGARRVEFSTAGHHVAAHQAPPPGELAWTGADDPNDFTPAQPELFEEERDGRR